MPYRLTRDAMSMSHGLRLRAGSFIAPGQVSPEVWRAWVRDGVIQEVAQESDLSGLSLDELRQAGKDAGIVNAHLMRADTLREKLTQVKEP